MITRSPRWKPPCTAVTPAGNRLLPFDKARAAPSSTEISPDGETDPAIQLLRAARGCAQSKVRGRQATADNDDAVSIETGQGSQIDVIAACDQASSLA